MTEKTVRAEVYGVVQGVFFRAATRDTALRLGLTGWVRNRPDGSVEAHFQGAAEAVDEAVAWCRRGPSGAVVDRVTVKAVERNDRLSAFSIRRDGPG